MSSEQVTRLQRRWELDSQYPETVLKVPDTLGLAKGAISKEMHLTGREIFKVTIYLSLHVLACITMSYLWLSRNVHNVSGYCRM